MIEISKEFPVSVKELYKAWISPEALKQWWSPMGKKLTEVKNDVREGGSIKYSANGGENPLVIEGEYQEVKENDKLVYTWNFNFSNEALEESPYRLTINFREEGEGSLLQVKQENLKDNEAVEVHKKGWEKELENLRDYLDQKKA